MARKTRVTKNREILPDRRFGSALVSRFIRKIMWEGKKHLAEDLVYRALEIAGEKSKKKPEETLELAIKNVAPMIMIRSRRVGGANYQVPVPVSSEKKLQLATMWLISAARDRKGQSFDKSLAAEILAAMNEEGAAFKKKEDTHRMAEANKAFAHFARF